MLNVLKAMATKDMNLLERSAAGFKEPELKLLQIWVYEAITLQWSVFSPEESSGLTRDPNFARRLLLSVYADIRPQLLVETMFERFM